MSQFWEIHLSPPLKMPTPMRDVENSRRLSRTGW